MKKKLLSLVMACAMILSLAVPAFAANYFDYAAEGNSLTPDGIDFAAKIHIPTVKLSMPNIVSGSNPLVLNPYKLSYATSGTDQINAVDVGSGADKVKQIISPVYAIKNETNVALKFAVKATTEKNSSADFEFANSHVSLTQTAKQAFVQLVIKKSEDTTGAIATTDEQTLDPFDLGKNEVVVLATGDKNTNNAQLKKLAAVSTGQNYLLFQFQGSMTRSPSTGWTTDDTFTTTLTFTFTPEGNQDYTATAKLAEITTTAANYHTALSTAPAAIDPATAFATGDGKYNTFISVATNAVPQVSGAAVTTVKAVANATTPSWSLVSAGGFGATIDAQNGKISYPVTLTTLLEGGATAVDNKDVLIVGFNDVNGVPRTIGLTVTIPYKISG